MLYPGFQNMKAGKEPQTYLGRRMDEWAKARGTSIHAWATEARVHVANLYRALGGHRPVSEDVLKKLADVAVIPNVEAWNAPALPQLLAWNSWSALGDERIADIRRYVLDEGHEDNDAPHPDDDENRVGGSTIAEVEDRTRRLLKAKGIQESVLAQFPAGGRGRTRGNRKPGDFQNAQDGGAIAGGEGVEGEHGDSP